MSKLAILRNCHQSPSESLSLSAVLFDPGEGTTFVPLKELQAIIITRLVKCIGRFTQENPNKLG